MHLKILIIIFGLSLPLPTFSQVEINSGKLKELDEAARMAGADPMAAHKKNLDFWWNGDLLSTRQNSKQVSVPVHNRVGGIQVTNDYSTIRRSTNRSRTISKTHSVSPSEVNARINADREWRMEQARAKKEAERQRKRAEDDRSEMQAKMQHAIATASYYHEAAVRDHWNATEGYKLISEVKPSDFRRMSDKQETSGADLAAEIKPKEKTQSRIEVVSLSVLMKDKKLDDGGQVIVTENLYFDEQQMQEWAVAVDEEGLFDISSLVMNTQDERIEPILLVSHEELELDSICPFVLPQYGLVALSGDSLILLRDDELRSVAWIEGCESSYVVVCGDKLIGKNGKRLNIIKDARSEKLLEFDTNQYSIFPGDSTSIYVVCWYENISSVIKVDVCRREYNEIARLPLAVLNIAANEYMTLDLVENDVFLIEKEGKPLKFFKADDYINDIVMTENGLLVATDANIILARNAQEQSIFLKEGAKRLWSDGKDIYFQNMNDDLYLIESK